MMMNTGRWRAFNFRMHLFTIAQLSIAFAFAGVARAIPNQGTRYVPL